MHLQPVFEEYDFIQVEDGLSDSEDIFNRGLCLPSDIKNTEEDMRRIKQIEGCNEGCFGTIPMNIRRNAYGRQIDSFSEEHDIEGIGIFPMRFIRAPYIVSAKPEVNALSRVNDKIVAVEYQNQIALSFYPELTGDIRLHKYFIDMCYRFGK